MDCSVFLLAPGILPKRIAEKGGAHRRRSGSRNQPLDGRLAGLPSLGSSLLALLRSLAALHRHDPIERHSDGDGLPGDLVRLTQGCLIVHALLPTHGRRQAVKRGLLPGGSVLVAHASRERGRLHHDRWIASNAFRQSGGLRAGRRRTRAAPRRSSARWGGVSQRRVGRLCDLPTRASGGLGRHAQVQLEPRVARCPGWTATWRSAEVRPSSRAPWRGAYRRWWAGRAACGRSCSHLLSSLSLEMKAAPVW